MARFLDEGGKQALKAAIQSIESHSSAEVVISVRPRSGNYSHTTVTAAFIASLLMSAVLLYAEAPFALHWFLIDPALAGLIVGIVCHNFPPCQRLFTTEFGRRARVREAAQSTFFAKGVRLTQGRTGMLVYISIFERTIEIVCDAAVAQATADNPAWQAAVRTLRVEMLAGSNVVKIADALKTLGPILGEKLPRAADDVNELPDDIDDREAVA